LTKGETGEFIQLHHSWYPNLLNKLQGV